MTSTTSATKFVNYWEEYARSIIKNGIDKNYIFATPEDFQVETFKKSNSLININSWDYFLKTDVFLNIHFSNPPIPTGKALHLGIPPTPYAGDIENAKIVLLLTNPGFSPASYFYYYKVCKNDKERLSHLLTRQKYLNADMSWMPGYIYGIKRFRKILDKLQEKLPSLIALDALRKNTAVLQLSPYISGEVNYKIIANLPSTKRSLELAKALADEDRILICARSKKFWNLTGEYDGVVVEASNPRNPSFDDKLVKQITDKILKSL